MVGHDRISQQFASGLGNGYREIVYCKAPFFFRMEVQIVLQGFGIKMEASSAIQEGLLGRRAGIIHSISFLPNVRDILSPRRLKRIFVTKKSI